MAVTAFVTLKDRSTPSLSAVDGRDWPQRVTVQVRAVRNHDALEPLRWKVEMTRSCVGAIGWA